MMTTIALSGLNLKTGARAPLSPKMLTRDEQRRWCRMQAAPRRSPSSEHALKQQRELATMRDSYRQHANTNNFAYTESINRLVSAVLLQLVVADDSGVLAHPSFANLRRRCVEPVFKLDPVYRRATWDLVETNIDALIASAEHAAGARRRPPGLFIPDDDQAEEERSSSVESDNDDDMDGVSLFMRARQLQLSSDVHDSCLFKLYEVRELIEERAAERARSEQIDSELCAAMRLLFETNCSLAAVGCTDDAAHRVPDGIVSCPLCTNRFNSVHIPVVLRCCEYKQVACAPCLANAAFTGSAMACKSWFNCPFCRHELPLYEELDRPPEPPPLVAEFALSVADSVKQNKRKKAPSTATPQQQQPEKRSHNAL